MSEITDILSEINIPKDKAILLEHAFDKKYVALSGFPPTEWEKVHMIPIQQEQIRASERIESLRIQMSVKFEAMDEKIHSLKEEMNTRFQAMDEKIHSLKEEMNTRFQAMDEKIHGLKEEMNTRFQAMDEKIHSFKEEMNTRFQTMDEKFKVLMWMISILMAMAFAMFSKLFFGF